MLTIDRKLNLVMPIDRGDSKIYVHAMPISTQVFEKYYLVLAKTFSAFAENGIIVTSAPSVAKLVLKQVSEETFRETGDNWWNGDDGVGGRVGLIEEIIRLCNVIDGDTVRPLKDLMTSGLIDEDTASDLISLLIFFTVASRVPPKGDRERLIRGMASIYRLQALYLSAMDFLNSLKTSTSVDSTGKETVEA